MQNFVLRLASCFRERKDQLVFLINNYDMMLSVILVSSIFLNELILLAATLVVEILCVGANTIAKEAQGLCVAVDFVLDTE